MEKQTGLKRLIAAYKNSLAGLNAVYKNEQAFRQEIMFVVPMLLIALVVDVSKTERVLLIISLFLVLIVEILNSAIEVVVDRISKENHPLSGLAKDLGSSAVFLVLINLVCVWLIILV